MVAPSVCFVLRAKSFWSPRRRRARDGAFWRSSCRLSARQTYYDRPITRSQDQFLLGASVVDYIIVGGGSAGCVLAARLSGDPKVSVLLIEAGPPDRHPFIHLPAGFFKMGKKMFDWGYQTRPGAGTGQRRLHYRQARVLGGGSSINAQVFTRGCRCDYDTWAEEEGCAGWSW